MNIKEEKSMLDKNPTPFNLYLAPWWCWFWSWFQFGYYKLLLLFILQYGFWIYFQLAHKSWYWYGIWNISDTRADNDAVSIMVNCKPECWMHDDNYDDDDNSKIYYENVRWIIQIAAI